MRGLLTLLKITSIMFELIRQPWPWYVAGPLIGLTVPALLLLGNKSFGISSSLRHICAACIPANISFLSTIGKRKHGIYSLWLVFWLVVLLLPIFWPIPILYRFIPSWLMNWPLMGWIIMTSWFQYN